MLKTNKDRITFAWSTNKYLLDKIKEVAKKEHYSMSTLIKIALKMYFEVKGY